MYLLPIPIIASFVAACTNLCLRKSSTSSSRYLFIYYLASFLLSLVLCYPIFTTPMHSAVILCGAAVGICNAALLYLTTKALNTGSTSMTFAFQNTSYLFPGLILFLLFGRDWGFDLTLYQVLGMGLVLVGLVLGVQKVKMKNSPEWLVYVLASVLMQLIALTIIQGRVVLIADSTDADCWFMPAQFATSTIIMGAVILFQSGKIEKKEIGYGLLGGLLNSVTTALLLFATKTGEPLEQAIIFPCFAVGVILFCSLWAKLFYQEPFPLASHSSSIAGVIVSSFAGYRA